MLIFGILLTIALPSYLSLQDRANKTAAKQDIAQAMRAVNAYANDNYPPSPADPDAAISTTDNGYANITLSALATKYDASISTTPGAPFVMNPAGYSRRLRHRFLPHSARSAAGSPSSTASAAASPSGRSSRPAPALSTRRASTVAADEE